MVALNVNLVFSYVIAKLNNLYMLHTNGGINKPVMFQLVYSFVTLLHYTKTN